MRTSEAAIAADELIGVFAPPHRFFLCGPGTGRTVDGNHHPFAKNTLLFFSCSLTDL